MMPSSIGKVYILCLFIVTVCTFKTILQRIVMIYAYMHIWVNFPRTGKMVKLWHFLIFFLELCCDQTVWFFFNFSQLFWKVEKKSVWSQQSSKKIKKMSHIDHFPRPWEIDPYAIYACIMIHIDMSLYVWRYILWMPRLPGSQGHQPLCLHWNLLAWDHIVCTEIG